MATLGESLREDVREIFAAPWTTRDGRVVPEPEDIALTNDCVELDATVLYADIDGSTNMVDSLPPKVAAELYKTYLHCAAKIIGSENGAITAYDGDRIMAVFVGKSKNSTAVRAGLKIKYVTSSIVNKAFFKQYPKLSFELRQTVGIDTSKLLVARTGIRGSNDLVWVGPAANYAAKLSALSDHPYSTWITERIFCNINDKSKNSNGVCMWEARIWKEQTVYRSNYHWKVA